MPPQSLAQLLAKRKRIVGLEHVAPAANAPTAAVVHGRRMPPEPGSHSLTQRPAKGAWGGRG